MKKKQLFVSAAVMTAALAAPVLINAPKCTVTAYAEDSEQTVTGKCGENTAYTYNSVTEELVITGTGSVGYGSWYAGYVFNEDIRSHAKKVVIGNGITKIETGVFLECGALETVEISDSVKEIGGYAFKSCKNLKEITIPDGVESIGEQTFFQCTSLETAVLPDSITSVGQYAFYNCNKLKALHLSDSISSIGQCAFENCEALTEIHIPAALKEIGDELFKECKALEKAELPDSITQIKSGAFSGCSSLKELIMSDSVEELGSSVFSECRSLENVKLSSAIKEIGYYTFNNCKNLKEITIPENVQVVGVGAFYGCSSLTSVVIPQNVTKIEKSTFESCSALEKAELTGAVTDIEERAFKDCVDLKELTIPSSVEGIGQYAFENTGLTSVVIPQGVTKIGNEAFEYCTSLEKVEMSEEGLTDIGVNAFAYCSNLKELTIPSSVESIGVGAFCGTGLTSAVIPQKVTKIEYGTFRNCAALEDVTIPEDSVISIGYGAFADCGNLKKITIPISVTEIDDSAFSKTETCSIYGYFGSYAEYYAQTHAMPFCGTETTRHLNGWLVEDGVSYWYEYGVKQGLENRGKEIYDAESDAWYWLDSVQGGAKTVSKDVYQKSAAGIWAEDLMTGKGKWVRYDAEGHMVKGWQTTADGTYYFDLTYGTMAKGYATIDGVEYYFNKETGLLERTVGEAVEFGWKTIDGNAYWYENYNRQGCLRNEDSNYRGKEIYDPESDAWYWLDAQTDGSKAVSKDVYYIDYPAKWVRYDENGRMVKGWQTTENGTYYFDMITGKMAKGTVKIDDKEYVFDDVTGILQ